MRRLLLIDGNRADCGRLVNVLTGLGYGLDVTFNAKDARMLNQNHSYCWSVIGTPVDGMDAVELFTELRERQQRIRGLIVADRPTRKVRTAARHAGLEIISRPVDINVLIPWLASSEEDVASENGSGTLPESSSLEIDEASVSSLEETKIREELSNSDLIRIIRGLEYPFAGKERLEMFDRDTLVRVVLLIKRWCANHR